MKFDESDLRAGYCFLKKIAFNNDRRLPSVNKMVFVAKPLKAHGYHGKAGDNHCIWVDTTDTKSLDMLLRILAHEMLHAALGHDQVPNKYAHDTDFKEAARAIEIEMGWPRGSV
jgi:gentisate 1,2-dioxygenase